MLSPSDERVRRVAELRQSAEKARCTPGRDEEGGGSRLKVLRELHQRSVERGAYRSGSSILRNTRERDAVRDSESDSGVPCPFEAQAEPRARRQRRSAKHRRVSLSPESDDPFRGFALHHDSSESNPEDNGLPRQRRRRSERRESDRLSLGLLRCDTDIPALLRGARRCDARHATALDRSLDARSRLEEVRQVGMATLSAHPRPPAPGNADRDAVLDMTPSRHTKPRGSGGHPVMRQPGSSTKKLRLVE